MADKNYKLTFAMSDGTSKSVQFAAPQGPTGATGPRGTGVLKVTTAPSSYTTATGGFTPTYRIALSTVKTQAKVSAVLVGDTIMYSYYHYPVGYVDTSYVYLGARTSIRGATGAAGAAPVKGTDYWTAAEQEAMVNETLSLAGLKKIPNYVIAEAESVLDRVIAAQGKRTFTFAAITDLHYGSGNYEDGVVHACQAMKYIDSRLKLDAVAVLGDYTDGYPATDYANAAGDLRAVNAVLNDLRFSSNLRLQGNHDYYADHAAETRRYIQAYSDDVVWGSRIGGYYYKDFTAFKLRVIVLNTTETDNANIGCSPEQYAWFAHSLDMSAKSDAAEWQILVLSHHPVDWYHSDSSYSLAYIVNAYEEGASYSNSYVSCNFSGKNVATLIGNIHGHIHNLLTDKVHLGNTASGNKSNVNRMATPEACVDRANQYSDAWKEATTYEKTKNSADDTSFVVYCVDLDSYTINAICYGAGHDRQLVYHVPAPAYVNQIPISIDTNKSIYNGKGYKENTRLNSSGAETGLTGTGVTGFIPVKYGDTVHLKGIAYKPGVDSTGDYIALYKSDFSNINSVKSPGLPGAAYVYGQQTTDGSGNLTSFVISDDSLGIAYMRVSAVGLNGDSIITVNEEIK